MHESVRIQTTTALGHSSGAAGCGSGSGGGGGVAGQVAETMVDQVLGQVLDAGPVRESQVVTVLTTATTIEGETSGCAKTFVGPGRLSSSIGAAQGGVGAASNATPSAKRPRTSSENDTSEV